VAVSLGNPGIIVALGAHNTAQHVINGHTKRISKNSKKGKNGKSNDNSENSTKYKNGQQNAS
jgi:hypothetical protein